MNLNLALQLDNIQKIAAKEPESTKLHYKNIHNTCTAQLYAKHVQMTKSNLTPLCKIKQENVLLPQHISPSSAATLTFIFQKCDNYDITNDLLITLFHT